MFPIDENVDKEILKLYGRDQKSALQDVENLEEWLKTQQHLPEIMDRPALFNFLLMNKFSIEKTKQKLDMYYTIRSRLPDFFKNPKNEDMKEIMQIVYFIPLPKLNSEHYKIFWFKIRKPELVNDLLLPQKFIGHAINITEIIHREEYKLGDVFVQDYKNIGFSYFSKITPTLIRNWLTIYEKIFSMPMKHLYIINSPPIMQTILAITKQIMKPKLFKRIEVYSDDTILHKLFTKEEIPKDYGGDGILLEKHHEIWMKKFDDYQERFDKLDSMKVNESLRPVRLHNDELLGFHGNFKKMDVD